MIPFDNLSDYSEQEYFSDGITEDVITALSRVLLLSVIVRHSSFSFKGKSLDIRDIGSQLQVEYILVGSVRRLGDRIRISVQLVETDTGNHIWAERYDRVFEDVFAIQDEPSRNIVAVLPELLHNDVVERVSRKPTESIKAYELSSKNIACKNNSIETLAGGFRQLWRLESDWQHIADGLRIAGLPN